MMPGEGAVSKPASSVRLARHRHRAAAVQFDLIEDAATFGRRSRPAREAVEVDLHFRAAFDLRREAHDPTVARGVEQPPARIRRSGGHRLLLGLTPAFVEGVASTAAPVVEDVAATLRMKAKP